MAVTLVNSGAAQAFSATSVSPSLGGTATSGNLLVLSVGGAGTYGDRYNTPSGWTKIAEVTTMDPTLNAIFVKTSDGTETGETVTWTSSGSHGAAIFEFSGATTTERVAEDTSVAGGSSNTSIGLGATASGPLTGDLALMGCGLNGSKGTAVSPSSGYTAGPSSSTNDRFETAWMELTSDGAVSGTLNWTNSRSVGACLVVLEQASAAATEHVWDGTAWVDVSAEKVWDGTAWVT